MPRRKRETIKTETDQNEAAVPTSPPAATPPQISADDTPLGFPNKGILWLTSQTPGPAAQSFKAALRLPVKGVTLGQRNGHDWVISFSRGPRQGNQGQAARRGV